jgi:hypothetical protein
MVALGGSGPQCVITQVRQLLLKLSHGAPFFVGHVRRVQPVRHFLEGAGRGKYGGVSCQSAGRRDTRIGL